MTQPRLLLLPGTQCNELLWQDLYSEISSTFSCRHWTIPQVEFELVLAQLHRDILALLSDRVSDGSQRKARKLVVFGFSLGGYIVARYLAEYGIRLDKWLLDNPNSPRPAFVICSHTPTALPKKELDQRRRILQFLSKNDYAGVSKERVCQLLGAEQHSNDHIISTIQEMDRVLGKSNLIHQLSFTGARIDSFAETIDCSNYFEIDFVCTHDDPLVDVEWLQNLKGRVSCSFIGDSGHMLPLEHPLLLANWLKCRYC